MGKSCVATWNIWDTLMLRLKVKKTLLRLILNFCVSRDLSIRELVRSNDKMKLNLFFILTVKPQQNPKEVQEYYELVEGGKNTIRMMFRANPKPSSGEWQVSGQTIAVGGESEDKKFQSTPIEEDVRKFNN